LQNNQQDILYKLKALLQLNEIPYRIEAFDSSMMMGQAIVGAMVVWQQQWIKSDYRHYNLDYKDDYNSLRQMLLNRVKSFDKNPPPNLWVIDGGKALLDLAKNIIISSGANIDVIAISKEKIQSKVNRSKSRANDILYYTDEVLKLSSQDKRLQFIQMLRDESHRFVIEYHRKQKLKEDKAISLIEIYGIKEAKVRKLLKYFGTFDAIKNASLDDLENILNHQDATRIVDFFNT
jgi:excinuclease ABC subunit C